MLFNIIYLPRLTTTELITQQEKQNGYLGMEQRQMERTDSSQCQIPDIGYFKSNEF